MMIRILIISINTTTNKTKLLFDRLISKLGFGGFEQPRPRWPPVSRRASSPERRSPVSLLLLLVVLLPLVCLLPMFIIISIICIIILLYAYAQPEGPASWRFVRISSLSPLSFCSSAGARARAVASTRRGCHTADNNTNNTNNNNDTTATATTATATTTTTTTTTTTATTTTSTTTTTTTPAAAAAAAAATTTTNHKNINNNTIIITPSNGRRAARALIAVDWQVTAGRCYASSLLLLKAVHLMRSNSNAFPLRRFPLRAFPLRENAL